MSVKTLAKRSIDRKLRAAVTALLAKYQPTIVAVTGSVGKTSTKNAIAEVLARRYRVNHDSASYNTEIGLPLSFFGLKTPARLTNPLAWQRIFGSIQHTIRSDYPYDVCVAEMGADHPGEIGYFLEFIHPKIGVITGIGAVHTEGFGGVEAILAEKWLVAERSEQVVYNADFALLREKALELSSSKNARAYGLEHGTIRFHDLRRGPDGYLSGRLGLDGRSIAMQTQMAARTGLYSLLAAAAVADLLGVSADEIAEIISKITPTRGRMRLLAGIRGSRILDDSYNASPLSTIAALDTLADFPTGRRIAILGSMNELRDYSAQGHDEVGKSAAEVVDLLVTIGDEAGHHLAAAAIAGGLSTDKVKSFTYPKEAGMFVRNLIKQGDVVLVKGSQNRVFAEEAVKVLLDPGLDPTQVLVRQSPAWLKIKRDYL